jgi:hypothetical protein
MSNVAARLKPLDLAIKDGFLIFNSLLKEFETFEVNYNSMNNKWTLEKFIAMCVRKKGSSATMVVLIASTWLSTTKRGRIPPPQEGRQRKSHEHEL